MCRNRGATLYHNAFSPDGGCSSKWDNYLMAHIAGSALVKDKRSGTHFRNDYIQYLKYVTKPSYTSSFILTIT
jgi:hypothetical protein